MAIDSRVSILYGVKFQPFPLTWGVALLTKCFAIPRCLWQIFSSSAERIYISTVVMVMPFLMPNQQCQSSEGRLQWVTVDSTQHNGLPSHFKLRHRPIDIGINVETAALHPLTVTNDNIVLHVICTIATSTMLKVLNNKKLTSFIKYVRPMKTIKLQISFC